MKASSRDRRKNFQNCRILLIEDSPDQTQIIGAALRSCIPEVEILVAENVGSAMDVLFDINNSNGVLPKLILLDLYLPEREDGWEVLRNIKSKSSPFFMLPVIVLTNSTNSQDIKEAYKIGCSAYTVKPMGYPSWLIYFESIREHWLETVMLPSQQD